MAGVQWDALTINRTLTIEGNGCTISNLYVRHAQNHDGSAKDYGFGFISAANADITIKNLTFDQADIGPTTEVLDETKGNIGGVVLGYSYANTTLTNVTVANSYVSGYGKLGALVGYASSGSITLTTCKSENNQIIGGTNLGGLIGTVKGSVTVTIENSTVKDITFTHNRIEEELYLLSEDVTVETKEPSEYDATFALKKGATYNLNNNGYYYIYSANYYTVMPTGNYGTTTIDGKTYQFSHELAVNK